MNPNKAIIPWGCDFVLISK